MSLSNCFTGLLLTGLMVLLSFNLMRAIVTTDELRDELRAANAERATAQARIQYYETITLKGGQQ